MKARAAGDGEGDLSFRWISERDRNMHDGLNRGKSKSRLFC